MTSINKVSDCPKCGAGVKIQLGPDQDLSLSELTEADVRKGAFFLCPSCEIAWDIDERIPYEVPVMSPGPGGLLSEVSSGRQVSNLKRSDYRLLGYNDDGNPMFRDVGNRPFANTESPGPPHAKVVEQQLGGVIEVVGDGYPKDLQKILNALRGGYCVNAAIGETDRGYEFDATEPCEVVEAVPVNFAVDTDFVPEFADEIWNEDFDGSTPDGIPQARRTLYVDGKPGADVYVFPMALQNEEGVPLLTGIQLGETYLLEKFTANFTGAFTDGVIDVIIIAPADRPYFAVYCLGGDCLDVAHELRTALGLPTAHRGWEADHSRIFDIRYNPLYVERKTDDDGDRLLPVQHTDGVIDVETGNVTGDYFDVQPEPNEVVVTVTDEGSIVEVARLRAPSMRVGPDQDSTGQSAGSGGTADENRNQSATDGTSSRNTGGSDLSQQDCRRIADIVNLQPTSNGELADAWDYSTSKDVYQYISTYLDEYYYRDEDSRIRATDRAEALISDR